MFTSRPSRDLFILLTAKPIVVVVVELPSDQKTLSKAAFEEMVRSEYATKNITVTPTLSDDIVKTGASVKITDSLSLDVVLLGDVNKDGEVDVLDAQRITKKYIKDEAFDRLESMASNLNGDDEVDINDAQRIKNFTMKPEKYVTNGYSEPSSLPEEVINQSIGAVVKVETEYTGTNGLWDVVPNATNTQVTLKVVTGNGNTSFGLTGVPAGTTVDPSSSTEVSIDTITDGKTTVTVPRKAGVYTLTLKADNGSQTITINVEDVTLANNANVTFEEIQEEDINKISDSNVRANTQEIYGNNPTFGNNTITFSGNVNNMKGNKTYKARIKVNQEGMNNSDMVVAYLNGDKVVRITPSAVEGTSNTILVDLDATMAETKLVVAPSNAVDAQIKAAINSNKCEIVTFTSTSKLQLFIAKPVEVTNEQENIGAVQDRKANVITAVKDENISNKITIGANINEITSINLDKATFKAEANATQNTVNGKWIPIAVKLLGSVEDNQSLQSVISVTGDDILVEPSEKYKDYVYLWVNADKVGEKECTLVYNGVNNYKETMNLTIDVKDASDVKILSASAGVDVNAKGVIVTENPEVNVSDKKYTVNVDTYEYAMNDDIKRNTIVGNTGSYEIREVTGRWYSVILETNVPAENLVYWDTTGSAGVWKSLPSEYISEGKVRVWILADRGTENRVDAIEQRIANRYALNNLSNENSGKYIKLEINQTPKTNVEMPDDVKVKEEYINKTYNYSNQTLQGITIEEKKITDNSDLSLSKYSATLNKNLNVTKTAAYDQTRKVTTVSLPINDLSTITVNGEAGRWIVMCMLVKSATIVDENGGFKDGVYIDTNNRFNLIQDAGTNHETNFYKVPVWINLDNANVKKAISKANAEATTTPLEIKFSYPTPIKETNSFKLLFTDTSTATSVDVSSTKQPSASAIPTYDEENAEENAEEFDRWLSGADKSDDTPIQQSEANALKNNADIIKKGKISIETFDNVVHVTIRANLAGLETVKESDVLVPLELDMSALSVTNNDNVFIKMSKYNYEGWGKCTSGIDYEGNTFYLGAKYDSTKLVQDLYITKSSNQPSNFDPKQAISESNQITTPYIHYIIEFVQE